MGCDYYLCTYVVFCYKNTDDKDEEYVYEKNRIKEYILGYEYDPDFETLYDYLERLNNQHEKVDIYLDKKWLCLEEYVEYYNTIIQTKINNCKELVRVYKVDEAFPR
jgi:Xaa-Pro aminopeptidase